MSKLQTHLILYGGLDIGNAEIQVISIDRSHYTLLRLLLIKDRDGAGMKNAIDHLDKVRNKCGNYENGIVA